MAKDKIVTTRQTLFCMLAFIAILLTIAFGGPYLSNLANKSYKRDIDKNGSIINAIVTGKKESKGRYVIFTYQYKGTKYSNKESGRDYYNNLYIGESIEIKIDTTNPEDSYIFATGIKSAIRHVPQGLYRLSGGMSNNRYEKIPLVRIIGLSSKQSLFPSIEYKLRMLR